MNEYYAAAATLVQSTLAEAGYQGIEADAWFGVVAPAQTPKEKLSQMADWFVSALRIPEVQTKVTSLGLFSVGVCGAEFGVFIRKQYDDYGRVIRDANGDSNWTPFIGTIARTMKPGADNQVSFSEIRIQDGVLTYGDAANHLADQLDDIDLLRGSVVHK